MQAWKQSILQQGTKRETLGERRRFNRALLKAGKKRKREGYVRFVDELLERWRGEEEEEEEDDEWDEEEEEDDEWDLSLEMADRLAYDSDDSFLPIRDSGDEEDGKVAPFEEDDTGETSVTDRLFELHSYATGYELPVMFQNSNLSILKLLNIDPNGEDYKNVENVAKHVYDKFVKEKMPLILLSESDKPDESEMQFWNEVVEELNNRKNLSYVHSGSDSYSDSDYDDDDIDDIGGRGR